MIEYEQHIWLKVFMRVHNDISVLSAFRIQIINNKTFLFAITGHLNNVVNAQFGTLFTNNLAFVSLPVFKCFSSLARFRGLLP